MMKFNVWKTGCIVSLIVVASAIAAPAQTLSTIFRFNEVDGEFPLAGLVQGTSANFYGTTQYGGFVGGGEGNGTVFEITSTGGLTTLYSFCPHENCVDGLDPEAGLVQATDGKFYGTTPLGGTNEKGTVFTITSGGEYKTLYTFCSQNNCTDGWDPAAGLLEASNKNLYGTTSYGGANNQGTIFKISTQGSLTTLYSFCSQDKCGDGEYPQAGLVQAANGDLYGTTAGGGLGYVFCPNQVDGCGTIFKVSSSGKLTTLYSFCSQTNCTDGASPVASLVQASDGNFYGTTPSGGTVGLGTIFKVTPNGKFKRLYSFCSQQYCADGGAPLAGLVQATDGNFYGTTSRGGTYGGGTIFEFTPGAGLTTLYSFCAQEACYDGYAPTAGLMQATDGSFYGTTQWGGFYTCVEFGCGTIFNLSVGLGPFVETNPSSGKVGAEVIILGNDLTGATSVTFNGTSANFTVVSSTEIKTTVPTGATTGPVQVTLPSGTLSSNVPFRVIP
jgi:uncharacterized repeat protein (TIGR03803 family)